MLLRAAVAVSSLWAGTACAQTIDPEFNEAFAMWVSAGAKAEACGLSTFDQMKVDGVIQMAGALSDRQGGAADYTTRLERITRRSVSEARHGGSGLSCVEAVSATTSRFSIVEDKLNALWRLYLQGES